MQDIRQFLKDGILLSDGATGTYISTLTGRSAVLCETLNLSDPGLVKRVHSEYLRAGSRMILTNTFCANTAALGLPFGRVADIIRAGVALARSAAGEAAYVAGDIGPVREDEREDDDIMEEYLRIADVFLGEGVRIFQFETFADAARPVKTAAYIKQKAPDAFVIISFAVTPDGYSRLGRSCLTLLEEVKRSGAADAAGFNCCSGPAHLLSVASKLDYGGLIPAIKPNAGYPEKEDEVLIYSGMPEYFGRRLANAPDYGFRIIGGCCGTTPEHIRQLSESLGARRGANKGTKVYPAAGRKAAGGANRFEEALRGRKRLAVVELDPPFDSDIGRLEQAAAALAQAGACAVTIADSPMARPRADSVMVAARLRRLTGIEVIPHICCRDKNLNALKSTLIGAHMEGIRNLLAVTGDPVPDTDRSLVKSVFNLNSVGLCRFIRDLNEDIFKGDPMLYGCAFNINARNAEAEFERLAKKLQAGARFVFTQPVFSDEAAERIKCLRGSGAGVFAGILPPVSYQNASFLANEIPGIAFPQRLLDSFSPGMTREEGEAVGVDIALRMAERVVPYVDGFYLIIPFNRLAVALRLIDKLKALGIL